MKNCLRLLVTTSTNLHFIMTFLFLYIPSAAVSDIEKHPELTESITSTTITTKEKQNKQMKKNLKTFSSFRAKLLFF